MGENWKTPHSEASAAEIREKLDALERTRAEEFAKRSAADKVLRLCVKQKAELMAALARVLMAEAEAAKGSKKK